MDSLLEALPNELILKIVELVGKADFDHDANANRHDWTQEIDSLKSLRLVSRRVCDFASTILARNYLGKITTLLTRRSLETLADICAHPSFGPQVRVVHIVASRIHPRYFQELSTKILDAIGDGNEPRERVEALRNKLYCCMDRCTREDQLAKSGDTTSLLTKVFQTLRGYGGSITLSIAEDYWPEISSQADYYQLLEPYPFGKQSRWDATEDPYLRSTLEPCFTALTKSKLHIKELKVSVYGPPTDSNECDVSISSLDDEDLSVFSDLQHLYFGSRRAISETFLQSMERILSHAKHLEYFELPPFDSDEKDREESVPTRFFEIGERLMQAISSDSLSSLDIRDTCFSEEVLIDFLDRHKTTIRRVYINECSLRHGTWGQVFTWIKDNLMALEYLDVWGSFDTLEPIAGQRYRLTSIDSPRNLIKGHQWRDDLETIVQDIEI